MIRLFLFVTLAVAQATTLCAQRVSANEARSRRMQKKDTTLIMSCLLYKATEHKAERQNELYDTEEKKLILSSTTDTSIKAPADITITSVQRDSDGTYEIVFNHNDFFFWLSGVTKPLVRPRQNVKNGQPIGMLNSGAKIELLLFNFETPVEPGEYLRCGE